MTTTEKPAPPAESGPARIVSHEEIQIRAYEIFITRGGEHGKHEEDWLEAEEELLASGPEATALNPIDPSSATGAT